MRCAALRVGKAIHAWVRTRIMRMLARPVRRWGKQLYINSQSGVWVITTLMVLFGIGSALAGVWGRIPFIADAADSQL